jgi:hypothetical protein
MIDNDLSWEEKEAQRRERDEEFVARAGGIEAAIESLVTPAEPEGVAGVSDRSHSKTAGVESSEDLHCKNAGFPGGPDGDSG